MVVRLPERKFRFVSSTIAASNSPNARLLPYSLVYAITADVWQHATATLDSATFPEARTKPALVWQQRRSRTHPPSPLFLRLPFSSLTHLHTQETQTDTERETHTEIDTREIRRRITSDRLHTLLPRLHLPFVLAADQDTDRQIYRNRSEGD
jgi:hypothetical protein